MVIHIVQTTSGAASAEPSLLELCRVATEEDEVNASVTAFAKILKIYFVKSAKNLTIFQILTFYSLNLFQNLTIYFAKYAETLTFSSITKTTKEKKESLG